MRWIYFYYEGMEKEQAELSLIHQLAADQQMKAHKATTQHKLLSVA